MENDFPDFDKAYNIFVEKIGELPLGQTVIIDNLGASKAEIQKIYRRAVKSKAKESSLLFTILVVAATYYVSELSNACRLVGAGLDNLDTMITVSFNLYITKPKLTKVTYRALFNHPNIVMNGFLAFFYNEDDDGMEKLKRLLFVITKFFGVVMLCETLPELYPKELSNFKQLILG